MEHQTTPSHTLRSTLLIVLLLSTLFTWLCVNTSAKIGRLSNVPNYDDIVYFSSAADLFLSKHENGMSGVVDFALRDKLHSPYSTALAAAAFSVGGNSSIAAYRANGLLIAVYLGCIAYFFRNAERRYLLPALIFFLVPPFATMAIVEFRPDLAWAIVIGFATVFALTRDDLFQRPKIAALYGLFIGLALLIKPTTFQMTLAISGMAFGCAWLLETSRTNLQSAFRRILPTAIPIGLITVLLAGPYFLFFGKVIWDYFIINCFGTYADVWALPGDRLKQWLYYIYGEGSRSNLGNQETVLLATWLLLAVRRAWKGSPTIRLQTLFIGMVVVTVYAVNAIARLKSPFLGGAIYGTFLFSTAFLVGEFFASVRSGSRHARQYAFVALALITLQSAAAYQWPAYSTWPRDNLCNRTFIVAQKEVRGLLKRREAPQTMVFTQAGPVSPESMNLFFFARKQRPRIVSGSFFHTFKEFQFAIEGADLVVTQDTGTLGTSAYLPAEALQDEVVAWLRSRSDFELAKTIPIEGMGNIWRNVYVFARKAATANTPLSETAIRE